MNETNLIQLLAEPKFPPILLEFRSLAPLAELLAKNVAETIDLGPELS